VIDETGQVIGVISATDLLRFHGRDRDPINTKVWQMSSYRLICVSPADRISDVARLCLSTFLGPWRNEHGQPHIRSLLPAY
jgi:CBS domain-containing protein